MKDKLIIDEEGGVHLYVGKVVSESDLDALERILGRLHGKMQKLEKQAPTPEGTRLNILECVDDTLRTAQAEMSKVLEKLKGEVLTLTQRQNINRKAHAGLYKEIDKLEEEFEEMEDRENLEVTAMTKRDKRLTDIEEFLADL